VCLPITRHTDTWVCLPTTRHTDTWVCQAARHVYTSVCLPNTRNTYMWACQATRHAHISVFLPTIMYIYTREYATPPWGINTREYAKPQGLHTCLWLAGSLVGPGTNAASRKVAGLIPDEFTGLFNSHHRSSCSTAVACTQSLNRNECQQSSLGQSGGRRVRLTNWEPSMSRLRRKCGRFEASQPFSL
jgi:hypothetical protein